MFFKESEFTSIKSLFLGDAEGIFLTWIKLINSDDFYGMDSALSKYIHSDYYFKFVYLRY